MAELVDIRELRLKRLNRELQQCLREMQQVEDALDNADHAINFHAASLAGLQRRADELQKDISALEDELYGDES